VWFEAQARKVTVVKDLPEAPLWVRVNPIQIRQVLVNLLINAMEAFTGDPLEDHRVSVLAASDSGEVRVSIVDTGPGLGSAKPGQLFAPFFTTKPQGLGMGLAISKTIVEDHGGRIWACAAKPHGAAFHFALPECTGSEGHGCE
jgi:C4-dicarboxylate-specific signal transduction histidine kinase